MREHRYGLRLNWTGQPRAGTTSYESYGRNFGVSIEGKTELLGSADPTFRGEAARHTPEDWLLAAIAGCHMLSYLALCARRGVVVLAYEDDASGTMVLDGSGGGRFTSALLRPVATVADEAQAHLARELHETAHERCFIASSVSFPVIVDPTIRSAAAAGGARAGAPA